MAPPMLNDIGMYVWKVRRRWRRDDLPDWGTLARPRDRLGDHYGHGALMAGSDLLIMPPSEGIER
jgi:hypothetical protein